MKFTPHEYQQQAIDFLADKQQGALFLDPGAGKTAISLSHICNHGYTALVVAPLRVIYGVWRQEAAKWEDFRDLRFQLLHGPLSVRLQNLRSYADIHLINPEGLQWLIKEPEIRKRWDCLIVDESTKFKNWGAKRTKALRSIIPQFKSRVILTGTPTPNTLGDLFSQMYLADGGETLGKGITKFRLKYFIRGGFKGYEWILRQGAADQIQQAIAPRCYRIDMSDHLDMPDLLVNDIHVEMQPHVKRAYKELERSMMLDLEDDRLVASNAGAKYLMCRQMANGFVYREEEDTFDSKTLNNPAFEEESALIFQKYENFHDKKLEVIESIIEELNGKPVLIAYQFTADYIRLCAYLKRRIPKISGKTPLQKTNEYVEAWNRGDLPVLAVQPQALSHGMNMQGAGNDIIWLGLTDSLETYLQLNARLYRQGVSGNVRIHRILTKGTVDAVCRDRIESKDSNQKSLLQSLKEYSGIA